VSENIKDILKLTAYALQEGIFQFQVIEDGHLLATFFSKMCPKPNLVLVGISELFINAIEHGNLRISYTDKTNLQNSGKWIEEINRRVLLPENKDKYVVVNFKREKDYIKLRIKDQGNGFDWNKYVHMEKNRTYDNHGRGIAIAASVAFQSVKYLGNGNEVECVIRL
jgi:hypothetical protein